MTTKQYNQEELNSIVYTGKPEEELEKVREEETNESFSHEDLHDALMYTQDVLERSQIPFVLLDTTGHTMLKNDSRLEGDRISIGIMRRHWTISGSSMLRSIVPGIIVDEDQKSALFEYKGVPVDVKIIDADLPFFKNPNKIFYYLSEFYLPNPFDEYWKMKDKIE
jgi:hypothetical protein